MGKKWTGINVHVVSISSILRGRVRNRKETSIIGPSNQSMWGSVNKSARSRSAHISTGNKP